MYGLSTPRTLQGIQVAVRQQCIHRVAKRILLLLLQGALEGLGRNVVVAWTGVDPHIFHIAPQLSDARIAIPSRERTAPIKLGITCMIAARQAAVPIIRVNTHGAPKLVQVAYAARDFGMLLDADEDREQYSSEDRDDRDDDEQFDQRKAFFVCLQRNTFAFLPAPWTLTIISLHRNGSYVKTQLQRVCIHLDSWIDRQRADVVVTAGLQGVTGNCNVRAAGLRRLRAEQYRKNSM